MGKKRIFYLELSTSGTIGGSHHSLYFLVRELDKQRFEPVIGFYEHNEFEADFRRLGAEVHLLDEPGRFPGPKPFDGAFRIFNPIRKALNSGGNFCTAVFLPMLQRMRWLKANRIDLVHLNNHAFSGDWILACRYLGIPCVAHARGMRVKLDRFPIYLAARLDHVFCISQAVYESLEECGCHTHNFSVLHNGIDPDQLEVTRLADEVRESLGIKGSGPIIGLVGNIKRWKGQEVLVEALPALVRQFPDLVCLIVGAVDDRDKPYFVEIQTFIQENGLSDHVIFTGYTRQVPDFVNLMDVAIHASIEPEPFGRVIIEAMAMGKPIVASRDGGVPEIVDEPTCGRTFSPGSAEELGFVLSELLADPKRLQTMGQAGRERVDSHFHIASNAARTMEVYDGLLTLRH